MVAKLLPIGIDLSMVVGDGINGLGKPLRRLDRMMRRQTTLHGPRFRDRPLVIVNDEVFGYRAFGAKLYPYVPINSRVNKVRTA